MNRVHRVMDVTPGWIVGTVMLLVTLGVGAGCQSVESTGLVSDPRMGTPTVEELGEVRSFIEIVAPTPDWWAAEEAKRAAWVDDDYKKDLKRGFQAFAIPGVCTPTLEEFMAHPEQAEAASPFVDIQVRVRQHVTLKKKHQVISRSTFSRTATTRVEEVPVWSWWRWLPDQEAPSDADVSVVAVDLVEAQGLFSTFGGRLDAEGRLRVPLSPYIEHAIGSGKGLRLRISCPSLGLSSEVVVDRATLLHFQKLERQ